MILLDHDTLFKALDGTVAPVAEYRYPIGRWTKHLDPATLQPFKVGYHLARGPRVLPHLTSDLYVAEPCPEHGLIEVDERLLTCRVSLTRIATWNERTARLWAADCVESALLGEQMCGREPDVRSWGAVDATRQYADGLIGVNELESARAGAESAAWAAVQPIPELVAELAARVAARHAAEAAAWTAAQPDTSAALRAVVAATSEAAWNAWYAVEAGAARDVTEAAVRYAAEAGWSSAQITLYDRFLVYLNGAELPPVQPLYGPAVERSTR